MEEVVVLPGSNLSAKFVSVTQGGLLEGEEPGAGAAGGGAGAAAGGRGWVGAGAEAEIRGNMTKTDLNIGSNASKFNAV